MITNPNVWKLVHPIPADVISVKIESRCERSFNEEHSSDP
jgi:hypothetical protein